METDFTGLDMNIMTLAGLSLGVGMLVDNSVVVIENIYRLRGRGVPAARAAEMCIRDSPRGRTARRGAGMLEKLYGPVDAVDGDFAGEDLLLHRSCILFWTIDVMNTMFSI